MNMDFSFDAGLAFFITSVLLGAGLAMDAFSVSVVDGLNEPNMRFRKRLLIPGAFAFFQYLMPMIGWLLVRLVLEFFTGFQKVIPWIALVLLGFIGGKMLIEGLRYKEDEAENVRLRKSGLIMQAIATSIDALSVGFTIGEYGLLKALICGFIIAAVTFILCVIGVYIGRKLGNVVKGKASVIGGLILIAIGIQIFVKGIM